jgi:hypothetical protein
MSDEVSRQDDDDTVPHQNLIEDIVDARIASGAVDPSTHVTNASVAHALNATFSDTEAETALNALGTKINAILDILEEHGLMAPA